MEDILLRLTERQKKITGMLDKSQCAADIGCDHGRLGAYLIQSGIAQSVIAADISEKSLDKARSLARRLNIENKMQFRQGDGLKVLHKGEAQSVVIAGLSGVTIAGMLNNGDVLESVYILQPMSEAYRLRGALQDMGFEILDEGIAREHNGRTRFYEIIKCRWDGLKRSPEKEMFLYVPRAPLVRQDCEMKGFLEYRLEVCQRALKQMRKGGCLNEGAELKKQAEFYREGLKWLK